MEPISFSRTTDRAVSMAGIIISESIKKPGVSALMLLKVGL